MNKLYIDTTNNKEVIVRLIVDEKEYEIKKSISFSRAEHVLPIIDNLLTTHHLTPKDLTEIEVNPGPGSFTGVRVGVAIANALSFSLGIPVNGKVWGKEKKLVEPVY